ncbi:uncharacterized protein LOC143275283 [Babylonia areolata]|uniref:uncharacterized protein LOC143275283 n=1 Tax=Babylonia areolata TaxID=304850 RepID=UPI003FCF21F8
MAVWSLRSTGYKLGVLVLFVGSTFYLIGYSSPFWFDLSRSHTGLWLACVEAGIDRCVSSRGNEGGWFKAVQAMESIGLILLFISCLYAFVVNCCQSTASHSRILEVLAGLGGLSGFIGCMVFVGETHEYLSEYYGWAFGLNLTGCILVMMAAFIVMATNRPDFASAPNAGAAMTAVPVQGGNVVIMPQGQAYPPPGQGYLPPGQAYPPPGQAYPPPGQAYPPPGQAYPPQPGAGYAAQPGYGYPQGYPGAGQYPGGFAQGTAPPQAGYPPGYSAFSYPAQGYSGLEQK